MWLAYLNLENTYGEPPEEAALALFQRAAQACPDVLPQLNVHTSLAHHPACCLVYVRELRQSKVGRAHRIFTG